MPRAVSFSIALHDDLRQWVQAQAAAAGISAGAYIRRLIQFERARTEALEQHREQARGGRLSEAHR